MSLAHLEWSCKVSTLSPIILVLRRSNSGLIRAMYPSSVVHTGVKSLGWEKSTHQESPIQSWNRMRPSVVSASKSGARSPICRVISHLLFLSVQRLVGRDFVQLVGRNSIFLNLSKNPHS